jgi:DNA modification methylase
LTPSAELAPVADDSALALPKGRLFQLLEACLACPSIDELRTRVQALGQLGPARGAWGQAEVVTVRWGLWCEQLRQIKESRSLERARHYLRRLRRSFEQVKTPSFSDINLCRWQEYEDLWTDSLWHIERRDRSGQHSGHYWGNFVPQIPHQLMRRFSKTGDWVLDPFLGSGTTLIESRRLGRNALGVELQESVAQETWSRVQREDNPHRVQSIVRQGNSAALDFRSMLDQHEIEQVQLAILHPPYHDIIRFSSMAEDLSNQASVDDFVDGFAAVVEGVSKVLQRKRHLAVVIGDKYAGQNWVPLGFLTMQRIQEMGLTLKSIVVKNFEETFGKRSQRELWRYRALAGGFYVFKHEYIFLFQKP